MIVSVQTPVAKPIKDNCAMRLTTQIFVAFALIISMGANAYNVQVDVRVHETEKPLPQLSLDACDQNGKVIAQALYLTADTAYLFQGLKSGEINITGVVNGHEFAKSINLQCDTTLTIPIPADWLAHDLRELTVEGRTRYIDGDKTVYLPTKQQKNSAYSGVSLLAGLTISGLNVNPSTGQVTTNAGEGVSLFIDYLSASDQEVASLRPQDVLRVETLEYPADPRFNGARHVVNFVLIKYEYGGYTKLDATQYLDRANGNYSVKSKMVYRRMTYDLATGINYNSDNHVNTYQDAIYKFDDLQVAKTEKIDEGNLKNNSEYLTLRAIYRKNTTALSNTLGVDWSNEPYREGTGQVRYTPQVYPDGDLSTSHKDKSWSPSWKGEYVLPLDENWTLNINPRAQYTHTVSDYTYQSDGSAFVNDVSENAWTVSTSADLQRAIKKQSVALRVRGEYKKNSLHYTGSNVSDANISYTGFLFGLRGNLVFGKLHLQGNISMEYTQDASDNIKINNWHPRGFISAYLPINRKNSISMSFEQSRATANRNMFSPVLVHNSDIDAVRGNADLHTYRFNNVIANYNFMPTDQFSLAIFGNWQRHSSPIVAYYEPLPDSAKPVMVRSYVNSGYLQSFIYGLQAGFQLFDNALSINASVMGKNDQERSFKSLNANCCMYNFYAQYTIKDFTFSGYFNSKAKALMHGNLYFAPQNYWFAASWHRNAFMVRFTLNNFCNNGWQQMKMRTIDPRYEATLINNSTDYHRGFILGVSYSFNYGKKVKRGDEVGRTGSLESAILR